MKKARIFISYHPGSLVDFDHIRVTDNQTSLPLLIMCKHPYLTLEIISVYGDKFKSCVVLPDINYEKNIFFGFIKLTRYLREFKEKMNPFLDKVDSFEIISDCSAYLPVNAVISTLRKSPKFSRLVSIRFDYTFKRQTDSLKTFLVNFYVWSFGLLNIYVHKRFSYLYINEPNSAVITFKKQFSYSDKMKVNENNKKEIILIERPTINFNNKSRDMIVIFSDLNLLKAFKENLNKEEYENKLKVFFAALSKFYKGHRIIVKPHPQNKGRLMPGLGQIEHQSYTGSYTSQMFLELNALEVKACYSATSTALLYAAERGIPSYTFYKYLNFKNENLKLFFESVEVKNNYLLFNLRNINEIGVIDQGVCNTKDKN
ncbi:MAG: hypothetical protein ABH872_07450 [Candidatus Omnitrophota bacterium]